MTCFEGLSDDYVLRRRDRVREQLRATPAHLYPESAHMLALELGELNAELGRRADSVTISAEELELVGDDGTLDDALWRLHLRQGD